MFRNGNLGFITLHHLVAVNSSKSWQFLVSNQYHEYTMCLFMGSHIVLIHFGMLLFYSMLIDNSVLFSRSFVRSFGESLLLSPVFGDNFLSLFTYSFYRLLFCLFVRSFVRPLVRSLARSFVWLFLWLIDNLSSKYFPSNLGVRIWRLKSIPALKE